LFRPIDPYQKFVFDSVSSLDVGREEPSLEVTGDGSAGLGGYDPQMLNRLMLNRARY
jgi:hypothetical protein